MKKLIIVFNLLISILCVGCTSTAFDRPSIEELGYQTWNIGSEVPEDLKGHKKVLVSAICNVYSWSEWIGWDGGYYLSGQTQTEILCTIYNDRFTRLQVWNTKTNAARSSSYDWYSGRTVTTTTIGNSYKELDDLIGPMSYQYIIEVYE